MRKCSSRIISHYIIRFSYSCKIFFFQSNWSTSFIK
jgi:hypothetical protein